MYLYICGAPYITGTLPVLVDLREYCERHNTLEIRVKYMNQYFTQTLEFYGGND